MTMNGWMYVEGNVIGLTDPSGLTPCSINQSETYCILNKGGYLDIRHFSTGRNQAKEIIEKIEDRKGKRFAELPLTQNLSPAPFPEFLYGNIYYTNVPSGGLTPEDLVGTALGIFIDFQVGYENAQGLDPRCWSDLFYIDIKGYCSSFSNEDLPSDYLGFVSYSKGRLSKEIPFDEIVNTFGGGKASEEAPLGYLGEGGDPLLCSLGLCGDGTPRNNQCTFKIYDESQKKFTNQPWPDSLVIKSSGRGIYWAKSPSEFVSEKGRAPTPSSVAPSQGTPQPSGGTR